MSLDEVGEMMLISIQNVCKNYRAGDIETAALIKGSLWLY